MTKRLISTRGQRFHSRLQGFLMSALSALAGGSARSMTRWKPAGRAKRTRNELARAGGGGTRSRTRLPAEFCWSCATLRASATSRTTVSGNKARVIPRKDVNQPKWRARVYRRSQRAANTKRVSPRWRRWNENAQRRAEVRQTRGGAALRGRLNTETHIRIISPLLALAVGNERRPT